MATSTNPRRTPATTRPDGSPRLTLNTAMGLRKGATFHSPTSSSSSSPDTAVFRPPPLPRRAETSLDDVIDAHRRRAALAIENIDKTLTASKSSSPSEESSSQKSFWDDSPPVSEGFVDHTINMPKGPETERRVLHPKTHLLAGHHASDSGLGTSLATFTDKKSASVIIKEEEEEASRVQASGITGSAAASEATLPGLSRHGAHRIYEHVLKPLLDEPTFKDFKPLLLDCPRRIRNKEILCLRDLEKTLLLTAPVSDIQDDPGIRGDTYRALCSKGRAKVVKLYHDFCLSTIRCIQATVEYLSDREQTRPSDRAYTGGYFIDLVEQIRRYARELADAKEKGSTGGEMDIDSTDSLKLHGGILVNGRPAELVRLKENGKAISLATGEPVDEIQEESLGPIRIKRSACEELADEEEIMRSMARRKKNASPEELAPKKCREPGCNKQFKRPCDLTKHEKTHSRPWKCPVVTCKYHEYGWPTEKEMDRHHNDKHSAAPPMWECQFKPCPYKSKRQSNCKQHMEKAHGWTYNRTKTNGAKKPTASKPSTSVQPTPQVQDIPTPVSDPFGVPTPTTEEYLLVSNTIQFPAYGPGPEFNFNTLPDDLQLGNPDYSPVVDNATPSSTDFSAYHPEPEFNFNALSDGGHQIGSPEGYSPAVDNATPSTDPGLEYSPLTFQDPPLTPEFQWDDIYSANTVQIPPSTFTKDPAQGLLAFTQAEICQPQPAPHISPIGQGNAMLYTPQSLANVDEGFEDYPAAGGNNADFLLFPPAETKPMVFNQQPLFCVETPSAAAGYSQPSSQDFLAAAMGWSSNTYTYDSQQ